MRISLNKQTVPENHTLRSFDYIVIGQGLAGSAVALELHRRQRSFLVIDNSAANRSSLVAAGLYNPVTGQNWVKTWKADTLFPFMKSFYEQAEALVGGRFLHPKTIYRPFTSQREQNDWVARSGDERFKSFIKRVHQQPILADLVNNPLGGLELSHSGYLDIPVYLKNVRQWLRRKEAFVDGQVNLSDLKLLKDSISYKNYQSEHVILCQGSALWQGTGSHTQDLDLQFLPFRFVKGELLKIRLHEPTPMILNKGVFLVPKDDGPATLGATYDYAFMDEERTEKGRSKLISGLTSYYSGGFDVEAHHSGIRPATLDRRPFVGRHPRYPNVSALNGLGAKGVTLAPYCAKNLLDHLENEENVDPEVDIKRYIS